MTQTSLPQSAYQQTRRITLVGLVANLVLAAAKIVFGYIGHSAGLVADGWHSLSDVCTDVLILITAKYTLHGADDRYPYGLGRFETAATMGIALFVILAGVGIGYDALLNLFANHATLEPTLLTIWIALTSLVIKEGLFRYTAHIAHNINSQILLANAWHHRSDAASSIVVVIGILGARFGLPWLDSIAALVVAGLIIHMGWALGWSSIRELVDAGVEPDTLAEIKQIIASISGVRGIHKLRTRSMNGKILVDVHILADPYLSASEGHYICDNVEKTLLKKIDALEDVTVHLDPEDDEKKPLDLRLHSRAELQAELAAMLSTVPAYAHIQRITIHYLGGKIQMEILLPLSILSSQQSADSLRAQFAVLQKNIPNLAGIALHFVASNLTTAASHSCATL